jgi:peptide subunit release factor RF-3
MIRQLKDKTNKLQKQLTKVRSAGANEVSERSEMEQLFIECIEEVRKEVMRRRFRQEIANQKGTTTTTTNSKRLSQVRQSKSSITKTATESSGVVLSDTEAKDFEDSLYKLAQLQRKKIKIDDFTARDRFIILDLFVNNEKTLLKLYEALFPPRSNNPNHSPGKARKGANTQSVSSPKASE